MPSRFRGWSAIAAGLLTLVPVARAEPANERAYRQLDTFARVLAYIQNNYVDEVPPERLVDGAIQGMAELLDPHSVYLPAEVWQALKADPEGAGGLGLELAQRSVEWSGRRYELPVVVSPLDDTPAARAGLLPGDLVIRIDGVSTVGMGVEAAAAKLRGAPGTEVVLTIGRHGFTAPRDLRLVRERIRIVSVESRLIGPYGVVRIKRFDEGTDRFVKKALDDLRKEKGSQLAGLILDLRNDPGGLFEEGVRVADRFLPGGVAIVSTRGRGGAPLSEQRSHESDSEPNYPMVVLVNGGTASSSEIVAGALQDHGRATLVGAKTFGKGSVQTIIELENGGVLKLTVARYLTPKGRSIHERGLEPDVLVPDGDADVAVEKALELLRSGKAARMSERSRGKGKAAQM